MFEAETEENLSESDEGGSDHGLGALSRELSKSPSHVVNIEGGLTYGRGRKKQALGESQAALIFQQNIRKPGHTYTQKPNPRATQLTPVLSPS